MIDVKTEDFQLPCVAGINLDILPACDYTEHEKEEWAKDSYVV